MDEESTLALARRTAPNCTCCGDDWLCKECYVTEKNGKIEFICCFCENPFFNHNLKELN